MELIKQSDRVSNFECCREGYIDFQFPFFFGGPLTLDPSLVQIPFLLGAPFANGRGSKKSTQITASFEGICDECQFGES